MPKTSPLIHHLCSHVSSLELLNTRLQQQLVQFDNEKEIVCMALGVRSWKQLIQGLKDKATQQSSFRKYQQTLSQTATSQPQQSPTNILVNTVNHRTPLRSPKSTTIDSNINVFLQPKPYLQSYSYHSSVFQSPIQSESRLLNRSIRGDTCRQQQQQQEEDIVNDNYVLQPEQDNIRRIMHNNFDKNKHQSVLNTQINAMREISQHCQNINNINNADKIKQGMGWTLGKLGTIKNTTSKQVLNQTNSNSESHQDYDNREQQNMLLSVQNTKLRQKIIKLEAIIASKQLR